jgi:septum formation protein
MRRIILASGSPRRRILLQQLIGDNFDVKPSSYKENNRDLDPLRLVLYHSLQKGKDVAKTLDSGIVVSADTVVSYKNQMIGKPKGREDAIKTLKEISGGIVKVITGIAVIDIDNEKEIQGHETTRVWVKELSDKEIEDYVNSGEPLDKAGAFGIQGKGAFLVERLEGCYFNVVGLPLFKLSTLLEKSGISIFD